jgi:serine/threonine protein kinase HipA of HipAB toxin-antitoxin module
VLLDAILVVSVVFDVIDGEGAPGAGMPEIPVTLFDDRWGLSRERVDKLELEELPDW